MKAKDVLEFWFHEIDPALWFKKDTDFDQLLRAKFLHVYQQAARSETYTWRTSAEGRLAEIILLDQFPRNMFRDQPLSFACDAVALTLAQEAVDRGEDQKLKVSQKAFLYMPYMHSESPVIHEQAIQLFSQPGLESNLSFEVRHKNIIDQFGRYPHRNALLGRASTAEEIEFLRKPGSRF